MIDWKPGDVVVCIDDEWYGTTTGVKCPPPYPLRKHLYTLQDVILSLSIRRPCVVLNEVPCHIRNDGLLLPWAAGHFRKLSPLTKLERDEFLDDLDHALDVVALQEMYRQ